MSSNPIQSRVTIFVSGRVQGVGFRWWTTAQARELHLAGHARNTDDGRVEIVAEGAPVALETLLTRLIETPSRHRRPGRVTVVSQPLWATARGVSGFIEK